VDLIAVLEREERAEPWRARAACATRPVLERWWFPDETHPADLLAAAKVRRARAVCATCPVRRPCLEFALREGMLGVWGGSTSAERASVSAELPLRERVRRVEEIARRAATTGPWRVASPWEWDRA
jgi:WhiB family redox-sensing transcriptional regulator